MSSGAEVLDVRRRPPRRWPLVVAGVVATLAFVAALLVTLGLRVDPAQGPVQTTNDYLLARKNGDNAKAYGFLCTSLRSTFSRADFDQKVRSETDDNGRITAYDVFSAFVSKDGAGRTQYRLSTTKGRSTVEADLRKEGSQWRLCEFRVLQGSLPAPTVTTPPSTSTAPSTTARR